MLSRIIFITLIFTIFPSWAIYDVVNINITPNKKNISFCLNINNPVFSFDTLQYKNNFLYLAAIINQDVFLLSKEENGELGFNKNDNDGTPLPFQTYKRNSPPNCIGSFDIKSLENINLYAGVGSSYKNILEKQNYLPIFNGNQRTTPTTTKPWTVMVYMVGSDLESRGKWASKDILEMIQGSQHISEDDLNLVITTGGSQREGWQTVKRSWVKSGQQHVLQDLGEQSMAKPETLTEFVNWSVTNFPAQHYALILWNHGNGTNGFGIDDSATGNYDSLTLPELNESYKTIYKTIGQKLDIVAYDACLMGAIEVAEITYNIADTMSASAELEPGHGLNYKYLLEKMGENSEIDGIKFGQILKDGYIQQTKEMGKYDTTPITYSVYDLKKLEDFTPVFKNFTQEFKHLLETFAFGDYGKFAEGMIRAPGYPRRQTGRLRSLNQGHIHIDLYSVLKTIGPQFSEFESYAHQLLNILQEMTVDYDSNLAGVEVDAGRISINIGNEESYLEGLPSAYQTFSEGIAFYNQHKKRDAFVPEGDLTTATCPAGFVCAGIPNWLELEAEDIILTVDAYLGYLSNDTDVVSLYQKTPLYQFNKTVNTEIKLPINAQEICRYQICNTETECSDITINEQNGTLVADINLNNSPALLSFCQNENTDWINCGVLSQTNGFWGREDDLYFNDKIAPLKLFYENQKITQEVGTAITVNETGLVKLTKHCSLEQATIITSVTSANDKPGYQQICTDISCADAGVYIRP